MFFYIGQIALNFPIQCKKIIISDYQWIQSVNNAIPGHLFPYWHIDFIQYY